MLETHSIYETKASLSALLRSVKSGKEIGITERGTPIAKIVPWVEKETLDEKIDRMIRMGQARPGQKGHLKPMAKRKGALQRFLASRE